jgi:RNA polymerase sigma-70 factor (ECF subfamily)
VHDAFETALSKPGSYDRRKGALRPWFLRVVRNRCIDMLRRRHGSDVPVDTLLDRGQMPDEALESAQTAATIQAALRSIPSDKRQIVVLRDYLDLSYAEIADVLDIAPGTVMSRLHRARMALKEALENHDG